MPLKFKRRFRRKGNVRGVKRSFLGRAGQAVGKAVKIGGKFAKKMHTFTKVSFPASYYCQQPLPDRYDCWLTLANTGAFSSGAISAHWDFLANGLVKTFNKRLSVTLPNPVLAVGTYSYNALTNLLYNSVTSTGIWENYRVWALEVIMYIQPQTNGDNSMVCAHAVQNGTVATSLYEAQQSPSASTQDCMSGVRNVLKLMFSIPQVIGLSAIQYASENSVVGSFASDPANAVYVNVVQATLDNAVLTANLPFNIQLKAHVEFFGRVDVGLLNQ